MNGFNIIQVTSTIFLVMRLEKHLNWLWHINSLLSKVSNIMCVSYVWSKRYWRNVIPQKKCREKLTIAQKVQRQEDESDRAEPAMGELWSIKSLRGMENRSKRAGIGDYWQKQNRAKRARKNDEDDITRDDSDSREEQAIYSAINSVFCANFPSSTVLGLAWIKTWIKNK